jgi:hypothetical protein
MKKIELEKVQTIINQLDLGRMGLKPTQAMYHANGFFSATDNPIGKRLQEIVDKYDAFLSVENGDAANEQINRAIGLLDGYAMRSELFEESSEDEGHPTFTLNADEKAQVLTLASEMRKTVVQSNFFDHGHKVRLLRRIGAIEAEVHKVKGMFDVVLGGLNDVGEAFKKFGNDAKPLVDRMDEINKIVRGRADEYEQLPPPDDTKRLPPPEKTD